MYYYYYLLSISNILLQTKIRLNLLFGNIYQHFTFLQRLPVLPVFLSLKIKLFNIVQM